MSVTPSSIVVGIFRERVMAEQAIEALYDAGFQREQIRYSMPENAGGFFEDLKNMFTGNSPADTNGDHLANDLTSMGLSDEEAQYYTDEYHNGNTILTVHAAGREQEALSILHQYGAYSSRVSPGSFKEATSNGQAADHTQHENGTTPEQKTDIEDWETQRLPRTSEDHPVRNVEHEQTDQVPPSGPADDHPETYASQATSISSEHDASDQKDRSDRAAPYNPAYQASQANGITSGHQDELQQLQTHISSLQQQLEEAKTHLQAAKEHESHLQTAREREQQLQSARQQVQDLQAELQATLTELHEVQARIGQYR